MNNKFTAILLPMMVALTFQLAACGNSEKKLSGAQARQVDPVTDPQVLDPRLPLDVVSLDSPSSGLTVTIVRETNLSTSQQQKLRQAVAALNQVMNSPELKEKILNFTYDGKKQFYQNNGLSNEQIYQMLMNAAEVWPDKTAANHSADVMIQTYFPPWYNTGNAVAFTTTDDPYLNIYNDYFDEASISDLAKTVIHEWIHKLGFDHDVEATAPRPYSVPYGIGGLVGDAVQQYLGK